jgi:hypothetical protein
MTVTFSIEKGEMGGKSSHSKVRRVDQTRADQTGKQQRPIHVAEWRLSLPRH